MLLWMPIGPLLRREKVGTIICPDRKSIARELGCDWDKVKAVTRRRVLAKAPWLPKSAVFPPRKQSQVSLDMPLRRPGSVPAGLNLPRTLLAPFGNWIKSMFGIRSGAR